MGLVASQMPPYTVVLTHPILGPGEYLDSNPTQIPNYPWVIEVFGYIPVAELTIIGSGMDETVIGPMVYEGNSSDFSPKGLVWVYGSSLHMSDLTIRNCYDGFHTVNAPVFFDSCRFLNNQIGIIWKMEGYGGEITNCVFFTEVPGTPNGLYIVGNGEGILVQDCFFEGGGRGLCIINQWSIIFTV